MQERGEEERGVHLSNSSFSLRMPFLPPCTNMMLSGTTLRMKRAFWLRRPPSHGRHITRIVRLNAIVVNK